VDMPAPLAPQDLIDRLLVAKNVEKVEDLRGRTLRSVRTLQRWKKKGWPQSVAATLEMLTETGLLPEEAEDGQAMPADPLATLAAAVIQLAETNQEYGRRLREVEQKLDAVPRRRAKAPVRTKPQASGRTS
jgi:hypothetical protein